MFQSYQLKYIYFDNKHILNYNLKKILFLILFHLKYKVLQNK